MFVDSQRLRGRTLDVSMTGIAVMVPSTIRNGTYLRLNFAVKDQDGHQVWCDADGVVARSELRQSEWLLGIQFTVLEGHVASHIHRFVDVQQRTAAWRRELQAKAPTLEQLAATNPAAAKQSPPPGFPGGPTSAPITGEYGPVEDDEATAAVVGKTGTDDSASASSSGLRRSRSSSRYRAVRKEDSGLLELYRAALDELGEGPSSKKPR